MVEELPHIALKRILRTFLAASAEVLYGHQLVTTDNCFMKWSYICGLRLLILNTDILIPYPPTTLLLKSKILFINRDFIFQICLQCEKFLKLSLDFLSADRFRLLSQFIV